MKKVILMILAGILLMASVSAVAEYKDYRLTEGDMSIDSTWGYLALDAHNTVVLNRTMTKGWHVTWYRDGKLYRDISGKGDITMVPAVVGRDGDTLFMAKKVAKDNTEVTYMKWTEEGLTDIPASEVSSFDIDDPAVIKEGDSWKIRYHGNETVLPDSIPAEGEEIQGCMVAGKGLFLVETDKQEGFKEYITCIDHGEVKYKAELPWSAYFQAPDGKGGFITTYTYPDVDYSPVELTHYDAQGEADRHLRLTGNKVVLSVWESRLDEETGLCTIYGSAVAKSRKVFTVFAMTLDEDLKVCKLDMRKVDPEYQDYDPRFYMAPDGTAYVIIQDMRDKKKLRPVLIPFSLLEESKETYGVDLQ